MTPERWKRLTEELTQIPRLSMAQRKAIKDMIERAKKGEL